LINLKSPDELVDAVCFWMEIMLLSHNDKFIDKLLKTRDRCAYREFLWSSYYAHKQIANYGKIELGKRRKKR
jgi:hypothetical protein